MADEEKPKNKQDIKNLLKHLEDEHRKANISEQTYKELKAKYKADMQYLENSISDAPPPQAAPQQAAPAEETKQEEQKSEAKEEKPEGEKKGGLLGKIFHKKEGGDGAESKADASSQQAAETQAPAETPQQSSSQSETQESRSNEQDQAQSALALEIEKIKVMLDVNREQKTALDESIRGIFESIGEIRSMILQNDANTSQLTSKMERIEDDITQVRPKEIDKKIRDMTDKLEKFESSMEKMQSKTNDMSERINKAYELLKGIGGIENLIGINEDVQKKLGDIREATAYIERLASKAERVFIEVKAGLDDMIVYKAKQEALEESMKDLQKAIDGLTSKTEGFATKKDLDSETSMISLVQKEIDKINKVMAVAQQNIPEPIFALRKEMEDLTIFLESMEQQFRHGKLKMNDFEEIKSKNLEKLHQIELELDTEWQKLSGAKEEPKKAVADSQIDSSIKPDNPKADVKPEEPKAEAKPEEKKEETKTPIPAEILAQPEAVPLAEKKPRKHKERNPEEEKKDEEKIRMMIAENLKLGELIQGISSQKAEEGKGEVKEGKKDEKEGESKKQDEGKEDDEKKKSAEKDSDKQASDESKPEGKEESGEKKKKLSGIFHFGHGKKEDKQAAEEGKGEAKTDAAAAQGEETASATAQEDSGKPQADATITASVPPADAEIKSEASTDTAKTETSTDDKKKEEKKEAIAASA